MCINVYKIILLVCMCCVGICWISCSGNSDDSEQTEVILSVDKNTLTADGKDIITFTVIHAGIDVTADAIIRSVMDGQTLDGNTFSTSKAGTYAFEASSVAQSRKVPNADNSSGKPAYTFVIPIATREKSLNKNFVV